MNGHSPRVSKRTKNQREKIHRLQEDEFGMAHEKQEKPKTSVKRKRVKSY